MAPRFAKTREKTPENMAKKAANCREIQTAFSLAEKEREIYTFF